MSGEIQQEKEIASRENKGEMTIISHLEELRQRLICCLVAWLCGSLVAYYFAQEIMSFITSPVGKLYYLQPAEAFFSYLKITIFSGFLVALPVIFYQLWRFLLPALTPKERLVAILLVPASVVLFLGGMIFSFLWVLPVGLQFFLGMSEGILSPMLSIEKYIDFLIAFLLPFGLVFEIPLILIVLSTLGIVSSNLLKKQFRMVILLAFLVGAVLTPPDVISQCMIALPIILLYGISYIIVRYIMRK